MKLLRVDKIDDEYIGFRLIFEDMEFEYSMDNRVSCCEIYSVEENNIYNLIGKELISIRSYKIADVFPPCEIICFKTEDTEAFIYLKNEHNGYYPHTCRATYFMDGKIHRNEFQL